MAGKKTPMIQKEKKDLIHIGPIKSEHVTRGCVTPAFGNLDEGYVQPCTSYRHRDMSRYYVVAVQE
jgi:hypothetical protein